MVYYISEVAWRGLGGITQEERVDSEKPFATGVYDVIRNIEANYQAWTAPGSHFRIGDEPLRQFVEDREARKGGRYVYDGLLGRLVVYGDDYPRCRRVFHITNVAEEALAQWCEREKIWRRSRIPTQATLASIALEMIGRGWITRDE